MRSEIRKLQTEVTLIKTSEVGLIYISLMIRDDRHFHIYLLDTLCIFKESIVFLLSFFFGGVSFSCEVL